MTWEQWLMSEGRILFQLVMLWLLVIGLVGIGFYLHWQTKRLMFRLAQERAAAIEEVRKAADALAERTEVIAEALKKDTADTASAAGEALDEKMGVLLKQFDAVGKKQDEAAQVLHRELETSVVNKTTRGQIDAIQSTTESLNNKIEGENDK